MEEFYERNTIFKKDNCLVDFFQFLLLYYVDTENQYINWYVYKKRVLEPRMNILIKD